MIHSSVFITLLVQLKIVSLFIHVYKKFSFGIFLFKFSYSYILSLCSIFIMEPIYSPPVALKNIYQMMD